ncbi:MAG TPA: GAF domain-containing SpoIIE family protein phosphatase [Bryobacteraceae bacterium]|nr:GAF domain-containing SpoIIE family protein phosphatase [Bryobacteraceae bacterium]
MTTPRRSALRFRERAELLDFLLEVSRVTSETLDLAEQLSAIASIVKEVVPYDVFAILLYSERTHALTIRHAIGHREEVVRSLAIPLGEGIVGTAAARREPVLVEDVSQDPRYLNALDAVRSELAVPMTARGKLVGVLDVQSTRVKAYGEQDRSMLSLIASRVASSIENARLYRRVDRQNRTLRTLAHLSREFSAILDLDELLNKIASATRALMPYDAFSVFLVDNERSILRNRFSVRYDKRVKIDNIPLGKGITGAAVDSHEPVRVLDTGVDSRYIASHPGIRSELAVPLIVQDRVVGVLDVESERIAFFTEDHQRTLSLLAQQIASSVENARLYEEVAHREQRMDQDLKAARKLQRILLPREDPEMQGLTTGIRSRPAREISGDVFGFFEHTGDDCLIAFGDVSGKGAAAALYGALITGLLRTLAQRRHPAELIQKLNETLLERRVDAQYATLLVALWQPASRRFLLSNAGAAPPLLFRNGEILETKIEGVPIGLLDGRKYDEVELAAEPGDALVFYSDGVDEQPNEKNEEFGRERIKRIVQKHGTESPQEIADAIIAAVDSFRAAVPIFDDQTVVVLRVIG